MVNRNTARLSHIGQDVPDAIAFPIMLERLQKKLRADPSGCHIWTGYVLPNGYAQCSFRSKISRAHIVMYAITKGPVPKGMVVRHTCDNPICLNPDHLELDTQEQNVQDSIKRGRRNSQRPIGLRGHGRGTNPTHCIRGHALMQRIPISLQMGVAIVALVAAERR